MSFIVCSLTVFSILLFSVDRNDNEVHECLLNAAGLNEVARIQFNFHPTRVIFDVVSEILLVEEHSSEKGEIRMGTRNQQEWKITELARSNSEDIDITCWCRFGINKISLFDYNSSSVMIYEYQ